PAAATYSSTGTRSGGRPADREVEVPGGRPVPDAPVVEGQVGAGVLGHQLGVPQHRPDVAVAVVVVPQGVAQVVGRAVGGQVPGGGPDRLAVVVDVALPVGGPRLGHELHGALRAVLGGAPEPAHGGLVEVDRGEHVPRTPKVASASWTHPSSSSAGGGATMRQAGISVAGAPTRARRSRRAAAWPCATGTSSGGRAAAT